MSEHNDTIRYRDGKIDVDLVTIKDGKIDIDLFRKETDRNQYSLPSSYHSKQTTVAIPYSLALRIVRPCSGETNEEKQFQELNSLLLYRDYPEYIMDSAKK